MGTIQGLNTFLAQSIELGKIYVKCVLSQTHQFEIFTERTVALVFEKNAEVGRVVGLDSFVDANSIEKRLVAKRRFLFDDHWSPTVSFISCMDIEKEVVLLSSRGSSGAVL